MTEIDLIVLGILKRESLSAYDIQKLVDYRSISRWVRISTSSIYKKVIQLEKKGYIKSSLVKEGNSVEKAVYSLTAAGEKEFENLMMKTSAKTINIFLDLNAVIVNLDNLSIENQNTCLLNIQNNAEILTLTIKENIRLKEQLQEVPEAGMAVLQQQLILARTIESWLASLQESMGLSET